MSVGIIFFGNSESRLSDAVFKDLVLYGGVILGAVDVPPESRASTNAGMKDFSWRKHAERSGVDVLEPEDPNEKRLVDRVRNLKPDLIVAAGYMKRLRGDLLAAAGIGAVNFHASLLPAYRGKHPVFRALRNGEKTTGMTIHHIDSGFDTGDIAYQTSVRIRKTDSVADLYERILLKNGNLVRRLLEDAQRRALPARRQPSGVGSYYSGITDDDYRIDWNDSAEKIRRWITATPGKCFFAMAGGKVFCLKSDAERGICRGTPGRVEYVGRTRIHVATGDGILLLMGIRWNDGPEETAAGFCKAHGIVPGSILLSPR